MLIDETITGLAPTDAARNVWWANGWYGEQGNIDIIDAIVICHPQLGSAIDYEFFVTIEQIRCSGRGK